jgi:TatD DNase family protein
MAMPDDPSSSHEGFSSPAGAPPPLYLIDTHAHLCDPAFSPDLAEVMERALKAGVRCVVSVSEGIGDCRRTLELAGAQAGSLPRILPAAGLAPSGADLARAEEIVSLIRREKEKLCAIGEVGLDFWVAKDEHTRGIQREVLSAFIDLAGELDLPLNVHSRSAGLKTVELLLSRSAKKVQLHAFDGKASAAFPAVEAGYFFSIPPSVVRSEQKRKLVRSLPLRALLLETDSPVLGPAKQGRNEPMNLIVSLEAVAEIKDIAAEEAAEIVSHNSLALYGERVSHGGDTLNGHDTAAAGNAP